MQFMILFCIIYVSVHVIRGLEDYVQRTNPEDWIGAVLVNSFSKMLFLNFSFKSEPFDFAM